MGRRVYPPEFRRRALDLVESGRISTSRLGIRADDVAPSAPTPHAQASRGSWENDRRKIR
jgi:transposase-like protein